MYLDQQVTPCWLHGKGRPTAKMNTEKATRHR